MSETMHIFAQKPFKLFVTVLCGMLLFACASEYKSIKPGSNLLPELHHEQPYVIGSGDRLSILVWGHDKLTTEAVVRPDGKIALPLVGDVYAEGLTAEELKNEIDKRMQEYIQEPSVSVSIKDIQSLKVYLLGEVNRPGEYDLVSYTDVLHALAMAGGLTIYAKKNRIQIIRTTNNEKIKVFFNYNQVINGKNLEQNIPLKSGDVIIVP